MTKVMFGQNAIHIPIWLVAQSNREQGVMLAGASRSVLPMYGSDKIHALILGEVIVRPHIVIATNDFVGTGIDGFWTSLPSAEEWLANGDILVDTAVGRKEIWSK